MNAVGEEPADGRRTVVMVGCGNMGAAILAAASEALPDHDFVGVDPNVERAARMLGRARRVRLVPALGPRERPACVILAVKPQVLPAVVAGLGEALRDSLAISIAAGLTCRKLAGILPPGARAVRAMPNLAAMAGASMTVGFGAGLGDVDRATCERVFEAVGRFAWVDTEDQVDMATAVSGSGPGYVFAFVEQLARAAEGLGLSSEVAALLARQTVVGAGRVLERDDRSARDLKVAVTSPGGTTQAGLAELEGPSGLPACLPASAGAAFRRALELAGR